MLFPCKYVVHFMLYPCCYLVHRHRLGTIDPTSILLSRVPPACKQQLAGALVGPPHSVDISKQDEGFLFWSSAQNTIRYKPVTTLAISPF